MQFVQRLLCFLFLCRYNTETLEIRQGMRQECRNISMRVNTNVIKTVEQKVSKEVVE